MCAFLCIQGDSNGCDEYIYHVSPLFTGVTDQQLCVLQVELHTILQYLIGVLPMHFFCSNLHFHFMIKCVFGKRYGHGVGNDVEHSSVFCLL